MPAGILAALKRIRCRLRGEGVRSPATRADLLVALLRSYCSRSIGWTPVSGRIESRTTYRRDWIPLIATSRRATGRLELSVSHLILPAIALGTIPLAVIGVDAVGYARSAARVLRAPLGRRTADGGSPGPRATQCLIPVIPSSSCIGLAVSARSDRTIFSWPFVGNWLIRRAIAGLSVVQGNLLIAISDQRHLIVVALLTASYPRIRHSLCGGRTISDLARDSRRNESRVPSRILAFGLASRGACWTGLTVALVLLAFRGVVARIRHTISPRDSADAAVFSGGNADFILGTDPVGRDICRA